MTKSRGADAFVASLSAAGIRRIFTLSGNHVMPVFDALLDVDVPLVHVRHEAAAVHMADAWARLTGQAGVALVTGGPGHANAVGALYTASMAESPVVLLSGHAPRDQLGMGAFQEMRQADVAAPLTKAAWTCAVADHIAGDFAKAVRLARAGRPGPGHLSLPTDVLEAATSHADPAGDFEASKPFRFEPRLPLAAAVHQTPPHPRRPLRVHEARPRAHGARRGIDRRSGGLHGKPARRRRSQPRRVRAVLAQADCILPLGNGRLHLKFGRVPIAADCVSPVDPEDDEIGARGGGRRRLLHSAIANVFDAAKRSRRTRRPRNPAGATRCDRRSTSVPPHGTARRLRFRSAFTRCRRFARCRRCSMRIGLGLRLDGGNSASGPGLPASANRVINGVAGAIRALPFAIAARLAKPNAPVIAPWATDLDSTPPRSTRPFDALPFLAVVGNDARWNAEHQIQVREYGRRALGTDLLPT
jgi:acetolactate synthase-1/2/3 large subunit